MKYLPGDAQDGEPTTPTLVTAANEAMIEGGGRPPAWDPFEVWRTRVRDVREQRSRQKPEPRTD